MPVAVTGANQGPAGQQGPQGPPGPAGKIELVTCRSVTKVIHHKRRKRKLCTTKLVSGPVRFTTAATVRATLTRANTVFAAGTARTVGGVLRVALARRRPLVPGRYVLTLRSRHGAVVRRIRVTIA